MKRYNLINNILGWTAFVIAAVTYLLTLEPTASFWDCPEFITQGFKLEVGHPPGNPIFMLTARFFVTLFGGTAQHAAIAVNSMSALLSAGTILLLFWTITHLVRKLTVRDDATEISIWKTVLIMGAGLCGALAYTWSDTFWFSAVEGEVYAFSSFCTALVFWLILKWENRADQPHSDRYLVLIAYVIGVSIAVHLLNLLCIPAIVLVFYYKKTKNANVKGSLLALLLSAVIIFFILYGLVPGIIGEAQWFELLFVNTFHLPYNSGVLAYAVILVGVFIWTICELYRQRSIPMMKLSIFLSIALSGITLIGGDSLWLSLLLLAALAVWLFGFCKTVPVRVFNTVILSIFVIFIGYSSYALLLIRSSADTPMNQNSPDNVFDLASYLSRKQYGERPLFYGQTVAEEIDWAEDYDQDGNVIRYITVDEDGYPDIKPFGGVMYEYGEAVDNGTDDYAKVVKTRPGQRDEYVAEHHISQYEYAPDFKMLFTRMYDPGKIKSYYSWAEYENPDLAAIPQSVRREWSDRAYQYGQGIAFEHELRPYINNSTDISQGTLSNGSEYVAEVWKPSFLVNLRYFLNYQLNHMYWRYCMWNFAGRQNDMAGNGEPSLGNWISGIPAIDNARLGNQDKLPDEYGKDNPGHNVFYMLPLLLGIIGIAWQSMSRRHVNPTRGIEQFWVVFFLFFMTGIAIVLYLHQPPGQPRERDYAFAGSFYAFAIWIGMGVPAIKWLIQCAAAKVMELKAGKAAKTSGKSAKSDSTDGQDNTYYYKVPAKVRHAAVVVACVAGIRVPLQMVSQTGGDHDLSGRYTARDFGMNYLNSLDPNAIIFTYGDNDTFPLWYAQEVEGVRPDVKVVNLSYLATDWYINQQRQQTYTAAPIEMYARPQDYAYDKMWARFVNSPDAVAALPADVAQVLPDLFNGNSKTLKGFIERYQDNPTYRNLVGAIQKDGPTHAVVNTNVYAKVDSAATYKVFGRYPEYADEEHGGAYVNLDIAKLGSSVGASSLAELDIIANSIAGGWKRPVYFATTVPGSYYTAYAPMMYATGMAKMVTPFVNEEMSPVVDRAYENILSKWRWGGLDAGRKVYLDETVRRMVSSTRLAVLDVVADLIAMGDQPASKWAQDWARKHHTAVPRTRIDMARILLNTMNEKMPASVAPFESVTALQMGQIYAQLWDRTNDPSDLKNARKYLDLTLNRYGQLLAYTNSISRDDRARMGEAELSSLQYPGVVIGILNFLDLKEAMLRNHASDEELSLLSATLGYNTSSRAYQYFYVMDKSGEEVYEIYKGYGRNDTPYIVASLDELHTTYGVSPKKRTDEFVKKYGVSREVWTRLMNGN